MSDLRDLYQEVILDHYKRPRNFGPDADATCKADGANPLCGDKVTIYVEVEDDIVKDVHFDGVGCAISTASASLMTEAVKGKSLQEVETLFRQFRSLLTEEGADPVQGKLAVFSGVREFPIRVKCATLAWHTLLAAIHGAETIVTTE
jgi:nitrogen fixation NifU-like protein